MKVKNNLKSDDPLLIAEFILVMLASTCFVVGMFSYLAYSLIPVWLWFSFTFFILAKNWLEFFESHKE